LRVVIELKRGEVPEILLNNLYAQDTPWSRCSASKHGGAWSMANRGC